MPTKRTMLTILVFGFFLCFAASVNAGDSHSSVCAEDGWMTGGGSIFDTVAVDYGGRTTHGFVIHCDRRNPNRLQINWEGNRFHLELLAGAYCFYDEDFSPLPPDANFNTFIGTGHGRLNKEKNAKINFVFTDSGQPGVDDWAEIKIEDSSGKVVLWVEGFLTFGNHQAHSKK